jgi:hypothetical protein
VEHEEKRDVPKTIGELRQRLAELGNPWEVDPRLNDDDPLPDPPRGGQREEDIPEEARLPTLDPDTDLHDVISGEPPANAFLRARWEEAGLLSQDGGEDEGGGG